MNIYIWRERGSIHIYLYKLYIASNHILLSILVLAVFRTLVLVTCGRKVVQYVLYIFRTLVLVTYTENFGAHFKYFSTSSTLVLILSTLVFSSSSTLPSYSLIQERFCRLPLLFLFRHFTQFVSFLLVFDSFLPELLALLALLALLVLLARIYPLSRATDCCNSCNRAFIELEERSDVRGQFAV